MAERNTESVSLLVEGQLIGRVYVEAFEHRLDNGKSNIQWRGMLNQLKQRREPMRVTARAPMLVKEQDTMA